LAYVNAGGPVPEAMVVQGIQSLDATVTEHRIEVFDELTAAVSALHQASQARVEEAEGKWEEIRQKTRAVLFDARVTDVALDVTSEAYQLAPASWKEFVERVMAIDEQIAKMKLEALERWTASGQEREDRLSVIEESLLDIKKEIESKEKEFQDKLRALKQQEAEIIPTVTKVEELKGKLQREQQKLTATQQALDKNIAEVEQRTASTKRDTERKDAAKQRLEFVKQREQQQTRADDESLKKLEDAIRDANQLAARRRIELETLEMETRGGRWTRWMRRLRRR
jgi:hypothetical protein